MSTKKSSHTPRMTNPQVAAYLENQARNLTYAARLLRQMSHGASARIRPHHISPAGRKRIAQAQKKRWAKNVIQIGKRKPVARKKPVAKIAA